MRNQDQYKLVFWIASQSNEALENSYRNISTIIQKTNDKHLVSASIAEIIAMNDKLLGSMDGNFLFVFHDISTSLLKQNNALRSKTVTLKNFLPVSSRCHIMLTSTSSSYEDAENIVVKSFSDAQAINYVSKSINLNKNPDRNVVSNTLKQIKLLVKTLHHFPLALAHATSHIRQKHSTVTSYMKMYQSSNSVSSKPFGIPDDDYKMSAWHTWHINLEEIKESSLVTYDFLKLFYFFDTSPIPKFIIGKYLESNHGLEDNDDNNTGIIEKELNKHLDILSKYSLIYYTSLHEQHDSISVYGLTKNFIESELKKEKQVVSFIDKTITILESNFNYRWFSDKQTVSQNDDIFSHIIYLFNYVEQDKKSLMGIDKNRFADLLHKAAGYALWHKADFLLSKRLYNEVLIIRKESRYSSKEARALHALGNLHRENKEFDLSKQRFKEAHIIRKRLYGDNKSKESALEYAKTLSEQGALLIDLKDYSKALKKLSKALDLRKNNEAEKLYLAPTLSDIAKVHYKMLKSNILNDRILVKSKIDEALDKKKDIYEANHPELISTLCIKAKFFAFSGNYSQALKILNSSLKELKKFYGFNNHPDIIKIERRINKIYKNRKSIKFSIWPNLGFFPMVDERVRLSTIKHALCLFLIYMVIYALIGKITISDDKSRNEQYFPRF